MLCEDGNNKPEGFFGREVCAFCEAVLKFWRRREKAEGKRTREHLLLKAVFSECGLV